MSIRRVIRALIGLLVATILCAIIIGNSSFRAIREIYTQVTINAPAERVWAITMDTGRYPEWNPFIKSVHGDLRPGARIRVNLHPANSHTTPIFPTVLAVEPNHELRWRGHALIPGLFDGEHSFTVEPTGPNSCRFIQQEKFSGSLVPFAWRWITTDVIAGFREMNQALKLRAEHP